MPLPILDGGDLGRVRGVTMESLALHSWVSLCISLLQDQVSERIQVSKSELYLRIQDNDDDNDDDGGGDYDDELKVKVI